MYTTGARFLRTFAVAVVATAAVGLQSPEIAGTNQASVAGATLAAPEASGQQPRPWFKIGRLGVRVWAPVEAPYNAKMNRNLAADPLWSPG
jgi:hypothetical protein